MKKIISILALAAAVLVACNKEDENALKSIALNTTEVTLNVGESTTLLATLTPATAKEAVTFASDNQAVATVDNSGKVVAVAVGKANITAKAGEKTAVCAVTVKTVAYTAVFTENFTSNPIRTAFNKTGTWAVFSLGQDATIKAGLAFGWVDGVTSTWTTNVNSVYASSYWGPAFATESWIVSPAIDLSAAKYAKMTFNESQMYGTNSDYTVWACVDEGIQDLGSDAAIWWGGPVDVAPKGTWGQLVIPNHDQMTGSTYDFIASGDVDLNDYAGEKIRIAFKYIGTTAQAGTWNFSNIVVYSGE